MALKEAGQALGDLIRVGLVVTRKAAAQSAADERWVSPSMVSDLVNPLHPHRIDVEVVRVRTETPSTRTLRLAPLQGAFPPFRAGQFLNLFLQVDGVATSRPYAISSSPGNPGTWDITVRKVTDGFVSKHLCEKAAVGDRFHVAGPAGFFFHEPMVDSDRVVFLAGGCGITPFMSMIRQAAEGRSSLEMHLLYGNRVPGDIIFLEELRQIAAETENLCLDVVISEPPEGYEGLTGFLTAELIRKQVGEIDGKSFFICGPHAMYDLCHAALRELGVPGRRIRRELAGPLPQIEKVEGWPEGLDANKEVRGHSRGHGPDVSRSVRGTVAQLTGAQRHDRGLPLPERGVRGVPYAPR